MSSLRPVVAGVVAACALGTASAGATDLAATVAVTPKNGGTPRHPQGHKITVKTHLTTPEGRPRPTVTGVEVWYGRGIEFRRDGVPTCSMKTLAMGGPGACPSASKVGMSGNTADPIEATPKFQFIAAPGGKMLAYATLQRPARVRAVLGTDVVADAPGPWPYRDAWTFGRTLQVVAGIPISLDDLRFSFGYTKGARNYISSTSCPKDGWAWKVRVRTRATVLEAHGRAPCHR